MANDRVRSVSDSFNARAAQEGWSSFCDPDCAFRRSSLAQLHDLWRAKSVRAAVPPRQEFSPRLLKPFLRDLAIYEHVPDGKGRRYRVRLMGSAFAQSMGDLTGKFIDEAVSEKFLPRWYAALDAVLDAAAPLRFLSRAETAGKSFLVGEYLEAPMVDEDGKPTLILAGSHFSSASAWCDEFGGEHARSAAKVFADRL